MADENEPTQWDSDPNFREAHGFSDSLATFIDDPEDYDSLILWTAIEPGGITFRLRQWWRVERPGLGFHPISTVGGYRGMKECIVWVEVRNDNHGWQIVYTSAEPADPLAEEEDDTGDQ